jgi:hypothetical protein
MIPLSIGIQGGGQHLGPAFVVVGGGGGGGGGGPCAFKSIVILKNEMTVINAMKLFFNKFNIFEVVLIVKNTQMVYTFCQIFDIYTVF